MPDENLLTGLALIIILGIAAQWLAWRLRLPSILLLLVFGFLAGPVIEPERLLGDLMLPVVSFSVALILFEGGLSLRLRDVREVRHVVRNMVTVGAIVTWALTAIAARLFITVGDGEPMSWEVAILLGAVLIVTGPTVIIPLLRHVRPRARLESILRWEGIVIDPIGATIAVLVFQAILSLHRGADAEGASATLVSTALVDFGMTIVVGGGAGLLGAFLLYIMLKHYLIPDFLHNATTLMLVVAVFSGSNLMQHESGVLAVTVMGFALANQRSVAVKHIAEFKENLQILLISIVFILLSATLDLRQLSTYFDGGTVLFLAALILVVRPMMVIASTMGSGLDWREKAFLSMMAPRGVVAAAVASVFSLGLTSDEVSVPQAELLLPFTFMVIIVTVAFYGFGAQFAARWLGLADPNPQGTVIVGAHPWARAIARALKNAGCKVLVVDTNRGNLMAARMDEVETYFGNVLTEHALEEMELDGMGRVLALTPNDEVNSLAALHFREVFSSAEIYQLTPATAHKASNVVPRHMRGRYLWGEDLSFAAIEDRWARGARIKVTSITEEFDVEDFRSHYGDTAVPLFLVTESGKVKVITRTREAEPDAGDELVSLVIDPDDHGAGKAQTESTEESTASPEPVTT